MIQSTSVCSRRQLLRGCGAGMTLVGVQSAISYFGNPLTGTALAAVSSANLPLPTTKIIDTHQHLWDLNRTQPPWLSGASEVLRQTHDINQYRQAIGDLDIDAIYMEVDVAPEDHPSEAQYVLSLIRDGKSPTRAAVIGGRPDAADFADYLDRVAQKPHVKGVRQVLHGDSTPKGHCLSEPFVRGLHELGKRGLMFDLCMRPAELGDAYALAKRVPETHFILDHCGNADPKAFSPSEDKPGSSKPWHDPSQWKRDIERLAKCENVTCKISGIVARAPEGWTPKTLAPIVNHCLDSFGPDRVVFGSDWPVCLLGAELRTWVSALHTILGPRPIESQEKLWNANAKRIYSL